MLPNKPGRWRIQYDDGRVRIRKVKDINGELFAIEGGSAVPVAQIKARWLERLG